MRPITMMQAPFKMDTQSGTSLNFEQCKGGYFSTLDAYGLKVIGKTAQTGTPTSENPIEIRCVKAGTRFFCGESGVVVPCDLYEGDSWYPMTGKVERNNKIMVLQGENLNYTNLLPGTGEPTQYIHGFSTYVKYITDDPTGYRYPSTAYCTHSTFNVGTSPLGLNHFVICSALNYYARVLFKIELETKEEFIAYLDEQYANGTPVTIVFPSPDRTIEQYDPQFIGAPQGRVSVTQVPTELTAELSATMLVRR